jgi:hypothetical protein
MKLSKKGFQLSEVPQMVIVLLVVAIVLGVGATVLTQMKSAGGMTGSASDLRSTTATATNASAQTYNGEYNTLGCSGVAVYNGTNNKVVTSEFTLTSAYQLCTARILAGNNTIQGKTVTINYTKSRETFSTAYNTTNQGLEAQVDFSEWQTTFIVIIAGAIVLGIIYRYLFVG